MVLDFENIVLVAIINLIISEKLDVCKINMLVVGANFAYQKKTTILKALNIVNIIMLLMGISPDTILTNE
jgi:hypothetical protein